MKCNLKHVLSGGNNCQENPAGLANYVFIVPMDAEHISAIGPHDGKNRYTITPASGSKLKGWRIDFKSQTGQVTAEDNGPGKAWTVTGTGRVEKNEDDMAYVSRVLSNMDGKFLAFFPTGNITNEGIEWDVVGNPFGDNEFTVAADSGAARGDDHGQTFTVTCNYQVYAVTKWYGDIEKEDDLGDSQFQDDPTDNISIDD